MKNKSTITLEKMEKNFIRLIEQKDYTASVVFDLVKLYYQIDDLIYNRNHSKLIDTIYVKRIDCAKWAQSNYCNISHRTSFRYRHEYVKLISLLYKEETLKELVVTVSMINGLI